MGLLRKIKGILGFCQADGCWKRSTRLVNFKVVNAKRQMCEDCFNKCFKCANKNK